MSMKNDSVKSKKEQKKEESKKSRKYLKAYFNAKVGYRFKALGYFFRNNLKMTLKGFYTVLIIATFIFLGLSVYNLYKGFETKPDVSEYKAQTSKLAPENERLQDSVLNQEEKIDEYNISNSNKVVESSNVISKVFKGMYTYKNAEEYNKNRKENLKYFKDENASWIKSIYSENKDNEGNSLIETLNLNSEIQKFNLFTEDPNDTDSKVLKFKAIVEYQSDIDEVSNSYASRTHQTIYDIEFDTEENKIVKMKKENRLSNGISAG